jgi:hypothetical protein
MQKEGQEKRRWRLEEPDGDGQGLTAVVLEAEGSEGVNRNDTAFSERQPECDSD